MTFPAHLRTSTVVALAENIRQSRDYGLLPILADALQDAKADEDLLSPLRSPGIASSLSGLWLAGVRWDGLWEWGQLNTDLEADIAIHGDCGETTPSGIAGGVRAGCHVCKLRSRRAELKRLHTGACKTCGDRKRVYGYSSTLRDRDCSTCVLAVRERWDECRCEKCGGEGSIYESRTERTKEMGGPQYGRLLPCDVCGGTGDLLTQFGDGTSRPARPISFDSGPLPVVTVRLEEMVREEPCNIHRGESCTCSGTGVIHVPSEWLRALPSWYDVAIEGAESLRSEESLWFFRSPDIGPEAYNDQPYVVPRAIMGRTMIEGSSPAAAHAALRQCLRRWRFSCS